MNKENSFDDLMEEGAGKVGATDSEMSRLAKLIEEQVNAERRVVELELELEQAKKDLRRISEHEVPEYADQIGVSEFKDVEGNKIVIDDVIRCSIPKDRKEDAFAWLRENDGESLIKNEVKVPFAKGMDQQANELIQKLAGMGLEAGLFSDVHWQTLNAWAKEQIKAGKALNAELLGLYTGRISRIKLNKAKEKKGEF